MRRGRDHCGSLPHLGGAGPSTKRCRHQLQMFVREGDVASLLCTEISRSVREDARNTGLGKRGAFASSPIALRLAPSHKTRSNADAGPASRLSTPPLCWMSSCLSGRSKRPMKALPIQRPRRSIRISMSVLSNVTTYPALHFEFLLAEGETRRPFFSESHTSR